MYSSKVRGSARSNLTTQIISVAVRTNLYWSKVSGTLWGRTRKDLEKVDLEKKRFLPSRIRTHSPSVMNALP